MLGFSKSLCVQVWFQRLVEFHFSSSDICSIHSSSPQVRHSLPTPAALLDRYFRFLASLTSWEFNIILDCVFTNNLSWPLLRDVILPQSARHKLLSMTPSNKDFFHSFRMGSIWRIWEEFSLLDHSFCELTLKKTLSYCGNESKKISFQWCWIFIDHNQQHTQTLNPKYPMNGLERFWFILNFTI